MSSLRVDVAAAAGVGHPAVATRQCRVLLVAPSLQRLLGGQEVQGDQLFREWRHDSDVRLELLTSNAPLPRPLQWVERTRALRTLVRAPIQALALWRASRNADVLHAFSGAGSSFLIATLPVIVIARVRGKPVVVHYHSPLGASHIARSPMVRRLLRASQRVVVPSPFLHAPFAARGLETTIIPNVVDTSRFGPRERAASPPIVLSLRNFERRYGVDDVIRAFAQVKTSHPYARLLLAGSGPEEPALRALVQGLALPDVSFVGATTRDGVARLMAEATVLVNASRVDNMPVSILEAFAVGVPVVSTSAGGIPTFARDDETALLAPVGHVEALATQLRRVLDDPALAGRLTDAARREVAQCTWDAVRPQWLSLYRELLADRASSDR